MWNYTKDSQDEEEKQGLLSNIDDEALRSNNNLNETLEIDIDDINGNKKSLDHSVIGDDETKLRTFDIHKTKKNTKLFNPNHIKTSKYTAWNFLPKNLADQFSKLANIYFLVMMILQMIPTITITSSQPTFLLPLTFVIAVSAIKDIFEDRKRKKSDQIENSREVLILNKKTKAFSQECWSNVKVGQIVKITQNQFFPSDLILLKSSTTSGMAQVETKNLDGETALKHKYALKEFQAILADDEVSSRIRGQVICECPNDHLYKFEGTITLSNNDTYSIDHNNLLLRGTSLKNTEWILGLVVFTGHDSKIMMNQGKARTKFSKVEQKTNKQIILIFIFQCVLALICACFSAVWTMTLGTEHLYLDLADEDLEKITKFGAFGIVILIIVRFGTWMLLFANFVPISLMVTLEMVKFCQAYFIACDVEIYDIERDLPTKVQTSNLNEQLGQVSYIFSDKTGTLTCNKMHFSKFSVGKYSYGIDHGVCPDAEEKEVTNFTFQDENFFRHYDDKSHPNHENIHNFLVGLAICHTVVTEDKNNKISYNASSPDELALINAARYFGYFFKSRDEHGNIELVVNGETKHYELLNTVEFTSDRRRMSVIIRTPENKIKLICKGADNIIKTRLSDSENNKQLEQPTQAYLEGYASAGLRTLLFAEKEITQSEYEAFREEYRVAQNIVLRREESINAVADKIEHDLELTGSTAIEDQLQDDVDGTILALKKAGIKIWVLTGDKIETSINIGFSCKLLNDQMELYIINATTKSECLSQIADYRKMQINSAGLRHSATVVSGESLFKIMDSDRITKQFLKLTSSSSAVIISRMTPKQKADIVMLIQKYQPDLVTLAIGDGANDVSMITAAHVGIGISGVEGQQAVSCADYAIGQFKYLKTLLFVHGRESYRRNSLLVCYMFFKNVLFNMPFFWYGFYSAFSGQSFYEDWIFQVYNVFYTAWPIVIFGIFDFEYSKQVFQENPKLYKIGPQNRYFSNYAYWKWILYGVFLSALVFYMSFFEFEYTASLANGSTGDMWLEGTFTYAVMVVIANQRVFYESFSHTYVSVAMNLISTAFFFFSFWCLSFLNYSSMGGQWFQIHTYPAYYFDIGMFFVIIFPFAMFTYYVEKTWREYQGSFEKNKKNEARRKFTQGLDPVQLLSPIRKQTGFGVSYEEESSSNVVKFKLEGIEEDKQE